MKTPSLWTAPNLLSVTRIAIAPFVVIGLRADSAFGTLVAAVLIIVASITDWLDGYVARRTGQTGGYGTTLDPVSDKVFAATIVVGLMLYRSFPWWLAAMVVVRDLAIVVAGIMLLKNRDIVVPSNLTGKYAFASLAVLMGSSAVRFDIGTEFLAWVTTILLIASSINYGRVFVEVRKGNPPPRHVDSPMKRQMRVVGILGVICWLAVDFVLWLRGHF